MKNIVHAILVTAVLAGVAGFALAQVTATSDAADQSYDPGESVAATDDGIPRSARDVPTDALPADTSQVVEHPTLTTNIDAPPAVEKTPAGTLPLDATQVVEHVIEGSVDDLSTDHRFVGSVDGLVRQLELFDPAVDEMLGMVDSSIPPSERFPG